MDKVRVFWVERLDIGHMSIHFRSDASEKCPRGTAGLPYHHARVTLPQIVTHQEWETRNESATWDQALEMKPKCACGFEFDAKSAYVFGSGYHRMWKNPATGEQYDRDTLPVGAMFHNEHYEGIEAMCGADGLSIHVVLPDRTIWCVDGQANNCTKPGNKQHKCWPRSGDPTKGIIHVSKDLGPTCEAGAGSIQTPQWHGFLHDNHLVTC